MSLSLRSIHLRLALFFLALGGIGIGLGFWGFARRAGGAGATLAVSEARWVLAAVVGGVCLLGFAGVLVHRLYVLPQKQREIERYLRGIERESKKARALLEGAVDILLVVDPDTGAVRECNALARERLGVREAAADAGAGARSALDAVLAPEERERFLAAVRDASRTPGRPVELAEVGVRQPAGRTFPAAARIVAMSLDEDRLVEIALRDLTRQKELERSLRLHERMGSLGLLTASVAHEINNPLEGIGNYVALLDRPGLAEDDRRRYVELIRAGFGRIRDLTRDLLRFARPEPGSGSADLAQVAERAIAMVRYTRHCRDVDFARSGLDRPAHVPGDAARLEQVVVNLLLNAGKAMGGRGCVTIEARRGPPGEDTLALIVSDEGPGVPERDLERVFDPFFTTGDGTGLGLSVVYGIVQAHGGSIQVTNRRGGGAVFTILLPSGAGQPGVTVQAP